MDGSKAFTSNLKRILEHMGQAQFITAHSSDEALRALRQNKIDIIICNWDIPGTNGCELLKALRNSQKYADIPFIMMTGEGNREEILQAISAGVSELLLKPFTANTLMHKIKRVIAAYEKQAQPSKPAQTGDSQKAIDKLMNKTAIERLMNTAPKASPENEIIGLADAEEELRKDTLLVVDDTPENIDIIIGIFRENYSVKVANNGAKALAISASEKQPDLILLDIMMPELSGLEVCKRLKSNPKTADIPIIFLSALGEINDVIAGLELGAVDYVTKPAEPAILQARVKTHLRLKHAYDKLKQQNQVLSQNAMLREEVERLTPNENE